MRSDSKGSVRLSLHDAQKEKKMTKAERESIRAPHCNPDVPEEFVAICEEKYVASIRLASFASRKDPKQLDQVHRSWEMLRLV